MANGEAPSFGSTTPRFAKKRTPRRDFKNFNFALPPNGFRRLLIAPCVVPMSDLFADRIMGDRGLFALALVAPFQ